MISFSSNGQWQTKRHPFCYQKCFIGSFNECMVENNNIEIFNKIPNELAELDESDHNDMDILVEDNSFVAVYKTIDSILR